MLVLPTGVRLDRTLHGVDWSVVRADLLADDFDNGRTPDELARSFAGSQHAVVAWSDDRVVGTARILADGVCNAYLVDVWTSSAHRRRGIGSAMVRDLLDRVPGHHVALFTDAAVSFYVQLGFAPEHHGMSTVAGPWLRRSADRR